MQYLTVLLAMSLLWANAVQAQSCGGFGELEKFISFAEREFCSKNDKPFMEGMTFILMDASDSLSPDSQAWIVENVFKDKRLTHFQYQGGRLAVALMDETPMAQMPIKSVCSPLPNDQVSFIRHSPGRYRQYNQSYDCVVAALPAQFVLQNAESEKSLIAETITEIFQNPRYHLAQASKNRRLVIISDFFQNSRVVSFYRMCAKRRESVYHCPGYEEIVTAGGRTADYLRAATPAMRADDEVYLFNINVGGKIDQSTKKFWTEYFEAAGVASANIRFRAELDR